MISVMKLVGTGNDFLFIDGRVPLSVPRPELVRRLCDRHFGIGADGLVFVESRDGKFEWDFYNTDGSHAEMCGNATRCFGRWASLKLGRDAIDFATVAGPVHVDVRGDEVASYLEFVTANPVLKRFEVLGREVGVYWIDTGVPHFVAKVASIPEAQKDLELIRALRFHAEGGPRGANVTFLEVVGSAAFKTVTYERGVEDFTLSCGTGVVAAAAVGLQIAAEKSGGVRATEADVEAPGGKLRVRFEKKGVTLIGPALRVFETEIDEKTLR